jgi:outer membrane protein assembly factor BamB
VIALAAAGAGCGGGQTQGNAFDPRQPDDGKALVGLRKQLAAVKIPLGARVAVGVFGDHALVGVKLDGGEPWTFDHPLACRPALAGNVVVGVGADEMFGLDAATGKQLWTRKAGGCLRGVADDGRTTVVSARPVNGRGGIVLAIDRDGQVIRQIEDEANIGVPGLLDGVLLLPWDAKFVSAYDVSVGEEVARMRLPNRVTRAFAAEGALFFGERTVARYDENLGGACACAAGIGTVGLPERALPDNPAWMDNGEDALPPRAQASDRVRLYALPTSTGPLAITGGRYAATHGRVAMGLDAKDGALVWVRTEGASFLGGAAYPGGFALCDADGKIAFLDAQTGAVAGEASLGVPVDACLVQADGLAKTKAAPRPLLDEMAEAIRAHLPDDVPAQRFLLRELARSPDERATQTLIDLVEDGTVSEDVAPDVRTALAARRSGASTMLAALARSYDYLDGVMRDPPVAPLADALASMGEKRAAPLLADYLTDPATPAPDVEHAAAALEVLAGREELPPLREFFALYRSEASDAALVIAVAHVARALQRLGAGDVVAAAMRDPLTSDAVRGRLAEILPPPSPGAPAKGPAKEPAGSTVIQPAQ